MVSVSLLGCFFFQNDPKMSCINRSFRILYESEMLSLFLVMLTSSPSKTLKTSDETASFIDDSSSSKKKKTLKKPPPRINQSERDSDIDASDEELYKAAAASESSS